MRLSAWLATPAATGPLRMQLLLPFPIPHSLSQQPARDTHSNSAAYSPYPSFSRSSLGMNRRAAELMQ